MKKQEKQSGEKKENSNPILDSIAKARSGSKPRNFSQTWDFVINFRGMNMKKPENRFSIDVSLPKGRGKESKVAIFGDSMASEADKVANLVIRKDQIPGITKDKKMISQIIGCDVILGEPSLMALIGKELGPTLAPKGKMPRPLPPGVKLEGFITAAKRMIRVNVKESPNVHLAVGVDKMPDEDVAANAEAVFAAVRDKLPKGLNNIKSIYIKLTMGKPVKIIMK
jgi:large subunit ribosomal protein L1